MSGSVKLYSYKESSVVSFGTNYATGSIDATGLTVTISTSGGRVFVGVMAGANSYASTDCTVLKGSDPVFVVTSYTFPVGAQSQNIVNNGGTVPISLPTVARLHSGSDYKAAVSASGGSGIGTDSTFYWQYEIDERAFLSVQSLLRVGSSGEYGLDILRTTNSVTTTSFQYTRGFKTLGTISFPLDNFSFIEQPAVGTHVYKVQLRSDVTTGKIDLGSVKLVAYEI